MADDVLRFVRDRNGGAVLISIRFWEEDLLQFHSGDQVVGALDAREDYFAHITVFSDRAHLHRIDQLEENVDALVLTSQTGNETIDLTLSPIWLPEQTRERDRWMKQIDMGRVRQHLDELLSHAIKNPPPDIPKHSARRTFKYLVLEVGVRSGPRGEFKTIGAIAMHPKRREADYVTLPGWEPYESHHRSMITRVLGSERPLEDVIEYLVESGGQGELTYSEPEHERAPTARAAGLRWLARTLRGTRYSRVS